MFIIIILNEFVMFIINVTMFLVVLKTEGHFDPLLKNLWVIL